MGDERAQAADRLGPIIPEELRPPREPDYEELAWAAGLYDGEGTFGCYGKNDGRKRKASSSHLRMSLGQHHDPEVLERFVRAVGTGKIYGPYNHTGNKQRWVIQATGAQAVQIIETIWPWMSGPKRRQYEAALEKFGERSAEGLRTGRTCPPGCTCGRHNRYPTEGLTESQLRRREKMREYQARYRARKRGET